MNRNHDQSMGYWLNEPAILDPQRIAVAMGELSAAGYGIVRIVLRQSNFTHRSPEVVEAVRVATEAAHRGGMRLVLDCEPHSLVARELGRAYPAATAQRLHRGTGPVRDGVFRVDLQLDAMDGLIYDHVICAVVDGRRIAIPECAVTWETSMALDGIADARQDYVAGRGYRMRRHVRLSGQIAGIASGALTLHICFKEIGVVDFAAPELKRWYRELLDAYRHIPLDGVCWDEPAVAGDWGSYRYGRALAAHFAAVNGYALADRLHLLDAPGLTAEAVRVRLDYYRTLNETLVDAQADLIAAAHERFGPDLLLGNHHTWQGEGGINDYRAGAVDYFRLNDAMDAGYTDCCWWDAASVAYSYLLCSSLGRLTPSGEAECNTWHWKPTNRATAYQVRLMSLLSITWFNIWYGDDGDTCMFPRHYTWPAAAAAMRMHQQWQRFLGTAKPVVDIAMLHDWQGVCGTNLVHAANLHKAFCMNLAQRAVHGNVALDFIDVRLLMAATVEGGDLATGLGRYRVLVIPGAAVIERAAWQRITTFIAAGGKVVFAGPPPSIDAAGVDLTADFAELMGCAPIHADDYDAWFRAACPSMPQARPERFALALPLSGDESRLIRSSEGEEHGLNAPGGNAVWFSGYEASAEVLEQCRRWAPATVECHSASSLWRLYRDEGRTLLMLVAREDCVLSGIIEVAGHSIRITGGESACILIPDGGAPQVHCGDATRINVA